MARGKCTSSRDLRQASSLIIYMDISIVQHADWKRVRPFGSGQRMRPLSLVVVGFVSVGRDDKVELYCGRRSSQLWCCACQINPSHVSPGSAVMHPEGLSVVSPSPSCNRLRLEPGPASNDSTSCGCSYSNFKVLVTQRYRSFYIECSAQYPSLLP